MQPINSRSSQFAKGWTAWVWLIAGAGLMAFSLFQTVIPAAAWLSAVFLLRFSRSQRPLIGLPALGLAGYAAALVAMRGFMPPPDVYLYALVAVFMVVAIYGIDRWLAPKLSGVPRTLVFPLADTGLTFLTSGADLGTWGAPAYTQFGSLPLMQLAAVTGIWGIQFLIGWFAAVVNQAWEAGFNLSAARRPVILYVVVLASVLLAGGVRVAFASPEAPTVPVALLAPDRELLSEMESAPMPAHPRSTEEASAYHERYYRPLLNDLFARTRQAAQSGAKIVAWSEAAAFLFKEDEAALLEEASELAREEGIYLEMGLVFNLPTAEYPYNENRAILVDPQGEIAIDYYKATVPLNDGNAPGPGTVPVVDTPYGRLALVICYDADFPPIVRQAGAAGADILLVPSSDWEAVAEAHARMAVFRGVENGLTVVRPTRKGVSLASDALGRMLAYKADYFIGDDQTLLARVPIRGASSLYPRLGDAAAYLAVAGLVIIAAVALLQRRAVARRAREAAVEGD